MENQKAKLIIGAWIAYDREDRKEFWGKVVSLNEDGYVVDTGNGETIDGSLEADNEIGIRLTGEVLMKCFNFRRKKSPYYDAKAEHGGFMIFAKSKEDEFVFTVSQGAGSVQKTLLFVHQLQRLLHGLDISHNTGLTPLMTYHEEQK